MARIFISYKRVDKDKVFKIKDQIEFALGEKCWIDLDGIESDAQFANVIIKAINECEVFLFMYSAAHSQITDYKNDWTVRELDFAQHKKKRIVFVNLDGSLLSDWFYMLFGTMQQVDATSSESLTKLIRDIKCWLPVPNKESHYSNSRIVIPNAIFFKEVKNMLDEGRMVIITTKGKGMMPTISDGDGVTLQKSNKISLYDIVLAEVSPDVYVLLRVIEISGEDITLMGDGKIITEKCKTKDILARAVSLHVNKQEYQLGSSRERKWAKKWVKAICERDLLLRSVTQEQLIGKILPLKAR